MMKCWLDELLDFLFPEPVEQDIDGEPVEHDWYCPLPEEIPEHLRRLPVLEPDDTPLVADRFIRSARERQDDFWTDTQKAAGQSLTLENIRDAMDFLKRQGG